MVLGVVPSLDDARARRWARELGALHRSLFALVDNAAVTAATDEELERVLDEVDGIVRSLATIRTRVRHQRVAAHIDLVVASHAAWIVAAHENGEAGDRARVYFSTAARLVALVG